MKLKEALIEIGDRLVLAAAALLGENLLEAQRDIIEAQGAVIKAQDAGAESQDRVNDALMEWKDAEAELVDLHADYVALLERQASDREAHVENLEKKVDLQGQIIRVLKATFNYEEEASDEMLGLS